MIESTTDELIQLINKAVEENVSLEADNPREVSIDQPDSPSQDEGEDGGMDDLQGVKNKDTEPVEYFDHDDDSASDKVGLRTPDSEMLDPGQSTVSEDTFRDDLKRQIDELEISEEETYLAHYIIDSLDEDGYLRRPLIELVDDLEFNQRHMTTEEDLEDVLVNVVQAELEPSGIGARNLQECMLLQLQEQKGMLSQLAFLVVEKNFQDIVDNRWDRIEQAFGITNHQVLVDLHRKIRRLNPKPGNMLPVVSRSASVRVQQVTPDFVVTNEDGQLLVSLLDRNIPMVRISEDTISAEKHLQHKGEEERRQGNKASATENLDAARYYRNSIQEAQNFIDALTQRQTTLMAVMQTIVKMQRAYFITGQIETLVPMTLQDVADQCEYDVSTISRVSNSKFVETDFGIISVKELFQSGMDDTNQLALKQALKAIIDAEDKTHPLTDDALVEAMKEHGYTLARRTVNKYRESMGYPTARLRKGV